jgi:hypothetical protein
MEAALHGRDDVLGALRARLDLALGGRGAIALVSGEAGIGKSAVVAALARDAEERGAKVTWGRAWEFADAPPYFPLWPCFRSLGIATGSEKRDETRAFLLWEEVTAALSAAAPTVWILEDIHAADLGTLDLLTFLALPIRGIRALVIATVRTPDPRLTDRMRQRLARIARDGVELGLAPLAKGDVAAIIGGAVPERDLQRLMELTGGNPLFVVECARAFRAAGGLEGTLGSLPSTVRQVISDRLAQMPEATQTALAKGAILGREFLAANVGAMSNALPARIIDVLLPALRAGFIAETSPGRFIFTHAIVRDTIEGSLESPERARLHVLAESALRGDGVDVLVERARHALAGLPHGEGAEEVALRAIGLLEHEGAFDRAFELASRLDAAREAGFLKSAPLDLATARLARAAGRSDVTRSICERVIRDAHGNANAFSEAALLHASDVRPGVIDRTQVTFLEQARDMLGATNPALRCRVLARLATALQPAKDPSIPIALTHEAIAGARKSGDAGTLLAVLALAPWGLYTAPLAERVAMVNELRERAIVADDLEKAIQANVMLALYHIEASDLAAFDATVDTLLGLAEAAGHPRHRWRPLLLASMRAITRGQFAESERFVTEVAELAALIDDGALPRTLRLHEIFRARAARRDEEVAQRLLALDEALRISVDAPMFGAILRAACAARIRDEAATRDALALIGGGGSFTAFFADLGPAVFLAEAFALAGTDEQRRVARDLLLKPRAQDASGEVMSFVYEGPIARVLGLLEASLGELVAAERALAEALAIVRSRGHEPWIAQTSYELALVLQRAGRGEEAASLFEESAELARKLGMPGLETVPRASSSIAVTVSLVDTNFVIARGPTTVRIKDSRGMQILARLIASPNEELHVLALASDEPAANIPESSAGEMIDETAKRTYRKRLVELERDLEEAERNADLGRAERLAHEKEALVAELTRAIGMRGRTRQAGSVTERARVNVQRRVKDAIAKIVEADADLGRFFERSVRTGTLCCFRPSSDG